MKSSKVRRPQSVLRGPQNLSRAKRAVHKMMLKIQTDGPSSREKRSKVDPRKFTSAANNTNDDLPRKNTRRQSRMTTFAPLSKPASKDVLGVQAPGKNHSKNRRKKMNRKNKLKEEQEAAEKEQELAEANREDDQAIRRIEKDLHFRKNKKTKTIITPAIFKADGLDYLLDLVNENSESKNQTESTTMGDDDDDDDDEDDGKNCDRVTSGRGSKRKHDEDGSDDSDGNEDGDYTDDSDFDDDNDDEELSDDSKTQRRDSTPTNRTKDQHLMSPGEGGYVAEHAPTSSEVKMDPYGNLIGGGDAGTVGPKGKYVPPQKRAEMIGRDDAKTRERRDRLNKKLKGLINRLSETNMQSISLSIEEMYDAYSRNDMNESLTAIIMDSCVAVSLSGERHVMEHAMLLALLGSTVGSEVGAHFIQILAHKLDDVHRQDNCGPGKFCDNVVLLFTHLYNFNVIHFTLLCDIIHKLIGGFTERDIEMLLLLLKNAGIMLRKDDPTALKEIIVKIQSKASTCSQEFQQQSRVKFILETISAIRNNNVHKIPNYDPEQLHRMKRILRAMIKSRGRTSSEGVLRISLDDLLSAGEKGRWWIVGSSWSGGVASTSVKGHPTASTEAPAAGVPSNPGLTDKMVKLSRQQRMNTDLRKALFSVVMTAEDYMDSFEKILHMGLRAGQEREVVHVIINCCLQEGSFNPYYAHLGQKLGRYDRKYKMAFQFAFWDKFKVLSDMTSSNRRHLACFLGKMVASKTLSIAVLKVIEFGDIDKATVSFVRHMLQSLLLESSHDAILSVFAGITSATNLHPLVEGLRLFLLHFMLPSNDPTKRLKVSPEMETKLREKGHLANKVLAGEVTLLK